MSLEPTSLKVCVWGGVGDGDEWTPSRYMPAAKQQVPWLHLVATAPYCPQSALSTSCQLNQSSEEVVHREPPHPTGVAPHYPGTCVEQDQSFRPDCVLSPVTCAHWPHFTRAQDRVPQAGLRRYGLGSKDPESVVTAPGLSPWAHSNRPVP